MQYSELEFPELYCKLQSSNYLPNSLTNTLRDKMSYNYNS